MKSHSPLASVFGVALFFLVADDARGQSLDWVRQEGRTISIGGQSVDNGQAIAVDSQGNSYVTGTFRIEATFGLGQPNQTVVSGPGGQNVFVAKYDPNGMLLWARGGGGACWWCQDFAWGIAIDAAGNSYVTGALAAGGDFGNNVTLTSPGAFVVKYDSAGTPRWATALDPSGVAYAITADAAGNSFAAGTTVGPGPAFNPAASVWKLDAGGTPVWVRSTGGVHSAYALGVSVAGGTFSMTGIFSGTAIFGAGEPNQTTLSAAWTPLFVAKYDSSGNLLWARQSADGSNARPSGISTDAAGNSYISAGGTTILGADTGNPIDAFNVYVAKYDNAGNAEWATTIAPPIGQVSGLFGIASTAGGQAYITGTTSNSQIFIEKYSPEGDLLWWRRVAGITADVLALNPNGIGVDASGNAYLTGQFSGGVVFGPGEPHETRLTTTSPNFDFDMFVAKYLNDAPAQNTPPVAYDQDVTTAEDASLPIVLTANDADGNALTYSTVSLPAHGQLIGSAPNVTYVPNPNYFGSDQFTFRVWDGTDLSNTATVAITVTPVNDPPVANDQAVVTSQNTPVVVTLTGSDIDSANLTFSVATGPSHGTLIGNSPAYTYTPAVNYSGPDSFTFTASDGPLTSLPATVSIMVGFTSVGCGTLTSASITAAGEIDRYSFAGHAGQIISLALASTGGFANNSLSSTSAELTVFAPSGATAGTIRSNSQAHFALTETGLYTIRVRATNLTRTGSYNMNLECLIPAVGAVPLACGTLASGQIAAAAQVDLLTFSGQAGQIVSLALASTGGFSNNPSTSNSAELTVFAPSGALAGTIHSNSQANFTLSQSGTYVIRLSATNLSTIGSYNVNFECLAPPSAAVSLTCGTLASGQITAPAQVDLFTFSGQTGQVVSLAIASNGGFTNNPSASNSAELTVFAPSGTAAGTIHSNSQANLTLAQSGTYVIRVNATNLSTTGSYNLNFECLVPASAAVSLTCGTLASGGIATRAQVDLFTFSGQAGQVMSLALASTGGFTNNPSASNSAELTLFTPSGVARGTIHSNSQANFTLPETGIYVIRVSATNLFTVGSYNLNVDCLIPPSAAVSLTCGTLAAGQITAPAQVDLLTFAGQAGQIMSLALASTGGFTNNPSATNSAELTVFAPSGAAAGTIHSNSQANFVLAETGTYVIRVSATNLFTVGSYNLNFECLMPTSGAVSLACSVPASGQIAAPAQVDLFTLAGQSGQIVSLGLVSTGGFSGNTSASTGVELTLFHPSGAAVATLRSNSQASFTLPQTGTYVVRVSATNLSKTGTYRLTLGCT